MTQLAEREDLAGADARDLPGPHEAVEAAGAAAHEAAAGLGQGDVRIICALLLTGTRRDAARLAGVAEATLYRRLAEPGFRRAYQEAQRLLLEEAVFKMAGFTQELYARLA